MKLNNLIEVNIEDLCFSCVLLDVKMVLFLDQTKHPNTLQKGLQTYKQKPKKMQILVHVPLHPSHLDYRRSS